MYEVVKSFTEGLVVFATKCAFDATLKNMPIVFLDKLPKKEN